MPSECRHRFRRREGDGGRRQRSGDVSRLHDPRAVDRHGVRRVPLLVVAIRSGGASAALPVGLPAAERRPAADARLRSVHRQPRHRNRDDREVPADGRTAFGRRADAALHVLLGDRRRNCSRPTTSPGTRSGSRNTTATPSRRFRRRGKRRRSGSTAAARRCPASRDPSTPIVSWARRPTSQHSGSRVSSDVDAVLHLRLRAARPARPRQPRRRDVRARSEDAADLSLALRRRPAPGDLRSRARRRRDRRRGVRADRRAARALDLDGAAEPVRSAGAARRRHDGQRDDLPARADRAARLRRTSRTTAAGPRTKRRRAAERISRRLCAGG